ncbi:hypothetical protein ABW21_db0207875 [Orbilia brochopaga]|nr:hypothetical protein ABW21_db0207875 [Drechslerella brochopaga]
MHVYSIQRYFTTKCSLRYINRMTDVTSFLSTVSMHKIRGRRITEHVVVLTCIQPVLVGISCAAYTEYTGTNRGSICPVHSSITQLVQWHPKKRQSASSTFACLTQLSAAALCPISESRIAINSSIVTARQRCTVCSWIRSPELSWRK